MNMGDVNPVAHIFKEKVDGMKQSLPVVGYLRDPALKERHWEEIYETIGQTLNLEDDTFTLKSLIDMNVAEQNEQLGEIALKAQQEQDLEDTFRKVENEWKRAAFDVSAYKDSKDYFIIGSTEDINTLLEESLVTLTNLLAARFVDQIRAEVEKFYKKLTYLENLLNEWMETQRSWMYLENIFNSPDIVKSLASEAKKFN
jgi:dynein heavy chain